MTRARYGRVAMLMVAAMALLGTHGAGARALPTGALPTGAPLKERTMAQMGEVYGTSFDLPAPPAGQTPEQRANWVLNERPAMGKAPMDWVRWSERTFAVASASPGVPAQTDLATQVARLYAGVGAPLGALDQARIQQEASAMPSALYAPFADLVATVADVYAAQIPTARAVQARLAGGFDPHNPALTIAERDAMSERQAVVVRALNVFRARSGRYFESAAATSGPIFSDPEGLVILGGTGDDTYTRSGLIPDPILLVDPNGNDVYANSAGGACPVSPDDIFLTWMKCNGLVVSVVADLGDGVHGSSNDTYTYSGVPTAVQGAGGPGGLGILVDVGGSDSYGATMTRGGNQPFFYYFDGGGQGYGYAGAGLLLDGLGDDTYRFDVKSSGGADIWALAQGFGGAGGIGVAADGGGSDHWLSTGLGLVGGGFEGIYTDGVGFYGGVGIMTDLGGGNDIYRAVVRAQTVDFYAQGFGAFGGVGVLYDDGGNDNYYTLEQGDDPWIRPLLNCAYGTASYGGIGAMIDVSGNDIYYGASISPYGAQVMDNGAGGPGVGYGVFEDLGGNDNYKMEATGSATLLWGRGEYTPGFGDLLNDPVGQNTFGTFVDIGGTDTYTGGKGADNTQWPFGVDRSS